MARILFMGSNPAIGDSDDPAYPHADSPPEAIYRYFEERFDPFLAQGRDRPRLKGFWAGVRLRAIELLQGEPKYGRDYAVTDLVHCKSRSQTGARDAASTCADAWLDLLLGVSGADILVVLGAIAQPIIRQKLDVPAHVTRIWRADAIAGQPRYVTFLPHPCIRRGPKSFLSCMPLEDVRTLRAFLAARRRERGEAMSAHTGADLDNPSDETITRYQGMLADQKGRALLAFLAERKGSYYAHGMGHDPEWGATLRQHARTIRDAAGAHDGPARAAIQQWAGYLAHQERWERSQHDTRAHRQFLHNFGSYLAQHPLPDGDCA